MNHLYLERWVLFALMGESNHMYRDCVSASVICLCLFAYLHAHAHIWTSCICMYVHAHAYIRIIACTYQVLCGSVVLFVALLFFLLWKLAGAEQREIVYLCAHFLAYAGHLCEITHHISVVRCPVSIERERQSVCDCSQHILCGVSSELLDKVADCTCDVKFNSSKWSVFAKSPKILTSSDVLGVWGKRYSLQDTQHYLSGLLLYVGGKGKMECVCCQGHKFWANFSATWKQRPNRFMQHKRHKLWDRNADFARSSEGKTKSRDSWHLIRACPRSIPL